MFDTNHENSISIQNPVALWNRFYTRSATTVGYTNLLLLELGCFTRSTCSINDHTIPILKMY